MGHAEASGAANGHVAIVLHAHLPFVRHPEHERHLEERVHESFGARHEAVASWDRGVGGGVATTRGRARSAASAPFGTRWIREASTPMEINDRCSCSDTTVIAAHAPARRRR